MLAELGITSLKDMRLKRDLINILKFMMELEIVEWDKRLNNRARSRGHNLSYNMESFQSRRSKDYAFFVETSFHL